MTVETQRGQAIFITGPPLAGKTSTTFAWAERRARPTSPLDWDQLQKTLFGPRLQTDGAAISLQYRFAAKVAAATAAEIVPTGADCVITGARVPASPSDPPDWVGLWDDLDLLDPITIVLLPTVETLLARRLERPGFLTGGDFPFSEDQVRKSHAHAWRAWDGRPRAAVIDTGDQTMDEVIDEVEAIVARIAAG